MAKSKVEEPAGTTEVPLALAVIAGSLASTVSQNGVMKGAHDLMLALQAIRVYEAIKRVSALAEQDPEMVLEPVTDVAIARMYDAVKAENARIKAEAEAAEAKAAADAEAAANAKKPEGV